MSISKLETELILSQQGKIYHLGISKEDVSSNVILVGDPKRVELFGSLLDNIRFQNKNREYYCITGNLGEKELTILSTGIGVGNIDIVMNELDAVFNIDFNTKITNSDLTSLNILRIGTCGTVQKEVKPGSAVVSKYGFGLDNLMNYYKKNTLDSDSQSLNDSLKLLFPNHPFYLTKANESLFERVTNHYLSGITMVAHGFYGPQQRILRAEVSDNEFPTLEKISNFDFEGIKIMNIEMETSLIYAFAQLLGHKAIAVDMVLANRITGEFLSEYKEEMKELFLDLVDKLFD